MVLYTLYAKADLEGVTSLSLLPTSDICISVQNTTHDQSREKIVIETSQLHEADVPEHEKHRDEHSSHFALTWEGDKHRSTIRVVFDDVGIDGTKKSKRSADEVVTREMTPADDGQYVPILKLDCDGLKPYAFHPMGKEFVAVKSDGSKAEVDLSSGEWSDYGLSSGTSLITRFETKFE